MPVPDARLRQLRDLLPRTAIEGAGGIAFHLHELLGEGGQGWVYRATYDEPDGPWVVVKLLRPDVVNDEALSRFLREADVLRKLGQAQAPCPTVVRFYDHGIFRYTMPDGETYALPFTVLEYVHGTNLGEIFSRTPGQGLAVARVRRLFRQLARAIETIHAAQIVHRDIKPSNVLVASDTGQEVAKLSDFGLVKRFDVDVKGTVALAGASIGYAPPEQFEMGNKRVSARTDLFSFAAVLFEALAGRAAFPITQGESPFQVLSKVLSGGRPELAERGASLAPELAERTDVVAALDREIGRALSADPGERQASVSAFWDAVEPLLRNVTEKTSGGGTAKIPQYSEPVRAPSREAPPYVSSAPGPPRASSVSPPSGDFRALSPSVLPERARAAAVASDGRFAIALGRTAVYRFEGPGWQRVPMPTSLDPALVQGVLAGPAGEVILIGDRGTIVALGEGGNATPWAHAEYDVSWHAAQLFTNEIVLVGEHASRRRVLGMLRSGQPLAKKLLDVPGRLHGAARLATGALLACGEGGELVHVAGATVSQIGWGRTGHLLAVAPTPDGGAFVVGTGGHALCVTPSLEAKLEPVQTTRDLLCVACSPQGVGWAGATEGRVVKRTAQGWVRVPLPPQAQGSIRAIAATRTSVRLVLDDGLVLEGPA